MVVVAVVVVEADLHGSISPSRLITTVYVNHWHSRQVLDGVIEGVITLRP